jgi:predicted outer membrane protein
MHHVARREMDLGLLAQVAAVRPETKRFATEMEADFRQLDGRIVAAAEALGIGENRLWRAYADQNTVMLERQADDLDRLSMLHGEEFDRQFWVTVDRDQLAASDLLASAAGTVPSLDPLVADADHLLDRAIRKSAAAQRAAARQTGSNH